MVELWYENMNTEVLLIYVRFTLLVDPQPLSVAVTIGYKYALEDITKHFSSDALKGWVTLCSEISKNSVQLEKLVNKVS